MASHFILHPSSLILLFLLCAADLPAQRWTRLHPEMDTSGQHVSMDPTTVSPTGDTSGATGYPPVTEYSGADTAAKSSGYYGPQLWGYRDEEGRWAIEPQFTRAYVFRNGRALAAIMGDDGTELFGVIDDYGAWIIDPTLYGAAAPLEIAPRNGVDSLSNGMTYNYFPLIWRYRLDDGNELTSSGDVLSPDIHSSDADTTPFAMPATPDADTMDVLVIPPPRGYGEEGEYTADEYYERYGYPDDGTRYCVMDSTWRITIWDVEQTMEESMSRTIIGARIDRHWGLIGSDGKWRVEPRYRRIVMLDDPLSLVVDSSSYWYVDTGGRRRLGPFASAIPFMSGTAAVQVGDKFGIIDSVGGWVQPAAFDTIDRFSLYRARQNGRWSVFDMEGKRMLDDLDEAPDFGDSRDDNWHVVRNGKWGVVDGRGTFVLPIESEERMVLHGVYIADTVGYFSTFKQNGLWGIRSPDGTLLHPPAFSDAPISLAGEYRSPPFAFLATEGSRRVLVASSGERAIVPRLDAVDRAEFDSSGHLRYAMGRAGHRSSYVDLHDSSLHPYAIALFELTRGEDTSELELREPSMEFNRDEWGSRIYRRYPDSTFRIGFGTGVEFRGRFSDRFRVATGELVSEDWRDSFRMERIYDTYVDEYPESALAIYAPRIVRPGNDRGLFQADIDSTLGSLRRKWEARYRATDTAAEHYSRMRLTISVHFYELGPNWISYRIGNESNEGGPHLDHDDIIVNAVVEKGKVRRLKWKDLFRNGVRIDRLHFCPELGLIYGNSEKLDDGYCTPYTLGTGDFVLLENGLMVTYASSHDSDSDDHATEGYLIPYDALKKYMRPEIYALVRGS